MALDEVLRRGTQRRHNFLGGQNRRRTGSRKRFVPNLKPLTGICRLEMNPSTYPMVVGKFPAYPAKPALTSLRGYLNVL